MKTPSLYLAIATLYATSHLTVQAVVPNDPMFNQQWNMTKIGAPTAWGTTTGSTNIVVVVMDTGVDYTHPDIAPNMWRNPGETGFDTNGVDKATNGIDDDTNGYVDDVHGINVRLGTGDPMDLGTAATSPFYHGTGIAGIVGAAGNNGAGISGINWSVQIMAIRVGAMQPPALPQREVINHFVAAWNYVLDMKRRGVNVRIVNNSYGFSETSTNLAEVISAAGDEGILAVFGAGNNGVDQDVFSVQFPNTYNLPSVINVASSTSTDTLASDSSFGRSTVQLAAPGASVPSTAKSPGYQTVNGASFASPHVVGAAALLLAANPGLRIDQLKAALFASVDQTGPLKDKVVTNGRLNVARAFEYLTNANPAAIVIYASPAGQRTPTNAPIQVTFNRPMDRATVESALVITPPLTGTFVWTLDNASFSFLPDAPYDRATNYTVRILGTALDEAGESLDGNFNRLRQGSPSDDYVWTFRFPIPNDDFANAQLLAGASGSIAASNRYAVLELDEPKHAGSSNIGASVWYRWTAPEPGGWFTFDLTSGTAFDSLLAVYTGDRLDQVVAVAGNDNYGSKTSSRVSFEAGGGTNYPVVVAGKNAADPNQAGNFTLSWYPTPPPSFTGAQFSPTSGAPGTVVTLFGTNFTGATSVLFNGASASFSNAPTTNVDLRITAVVPPDAIFGPITVMTPHGNVTSTALFQVPRPKLVLTFTGSELQVNWPSTNPAWVLEETEDLGDGPWTPVAQLPILIDGETRVVIGIPAGNRFYRLKRI